MSANTDKVILRDPLTGAIKQLDYSTSVVAQDIQNAAGDKASYQFSNLSVISLATNQVLMGTGDFTLLSTVKPTGVSATESRIFQIYGSAGVNSAGFILLPDLRVVFQTYNGTSDLLYTAPQPLGNWGTYIAKRASGATSLFVNGLQVASGTSIKDIGNSTGNYIAGNTTSGYSFLGQQNRHLLFNYALSAEKIARYSAGAKLDYEDVDGSMSDNNIQDGGFANTAKWVQVNGSAGTASVTSGVARFSANTGGYILQDNAKGFIPLTAGKTYKISFTISGYSSGSVKALLTQNGVGSTDILNLTGNSNGTYTKTITVPSSGFNYIELDAATALTTLDVDNFSVIQLGAVLDLEPEGIGRNSWADSSGNNLSGAVTGAIPLLPNTGTYTPAFASGGVTPVLGNGTITGRYTRFGDIVFYKIVLTAGSTTTFGTSVLAFSLPFTANISENPSNADSGTGVLLKSGVSNYPLICMIGNISPVWLCPFNGNNGVTGNVPVTLGAGDVITLTGSYRV